jgi:HPt (histidine-containing phosphotransfer) domain-containing protein
VDAGLAFVGNSVDLYMRLLKRFVQLHKGDVQRMVVQAGEADRELLQQLAHAIKGGAATLGLSGLAAGARRLEEAAREAAPARLVELARALEADHADLAEHVAQASAIGAGEQRR